MKKLVSFSKALKKNSVYASTSLFAAFALFFSAAPCVGRLHEPEVPEDLR